MGCVQVKCCNRYPQSSDGEAGDAIGHFVADGGNNGHGHESFHGLTTSSVEVAHIPSHNLSLQISFLTQRGYYPDAPERENQDSFCIQTQIRDDHNSHFFGVFDGHGQFGAECANFAKDRLLDFLANDPHFLDDPVKACNSAFLATNSELHSSDIDDSMSGTTSITVLVRGNTLFIANAGDSRAVIAVKRGNSIVAEDLSIDQTPFRPDECERVKLCGARVLSVDQLEGLKDPNVQNWGDEENDDGDPPRLWVQNGIYPGTAFTRSIGDSEAEKIGVISVPEVSVVQITPDHLFCVIASDGVFEFLSSQAVVDMVLIWNFLHLIVDHSGALRYRGSEEDLATFTQRDAVLEVNQFKDPRDACAEIAAESYRLWLEHENRTDDITIIIVYINSLSNPGLTDGASCVSSKPALHVSSRLNQEVHRSRRGSFSESHPYPLDAHMERSSACVAPSPTQPRSFDEMIIGGSEYDLVVRMMARRCSSGLLSEFR